jgi:hypothetical protein
MSPPRDLAEALATAMSGSPGTDSSPPSLPLPLAQLTEFQVIRHQLDWPKADWQRWDLVRYGHRSGQIRRDIEDSAVLVFWRWLDPEAAWDQHRIRLCRGDEPELLGRGDCLIAHLMAGTLAFLIADSELLVVEGRWQWDCVQAEQAITTEVNQP